MERRLPIERRIAARSGQQCLTTIGFGTYRPGILSRVVSALATQFAKATLKHHSTVDDIDVGGTEREIESVGAALRLLAAADRRRYRRLKRFVRSVWVSDWPAEYWPGQRIAYLTSPLEPKESMAMELVQLATHGWLFGVAGLPVTPHTLLMRERICVREGAKAYLRCLAELGVAPDVAVRQTDELRSRLLSILDDSAVGSKGRQVVRIPKLR